MVKGDHQMKFHVNPTTHKIQPWHGSDFRGYMALEYALWGYLTNKADVYSFGQQMNSYVFLTG